MDPRPVSTLQPSQLYVDAERLRNVLAWLEPERPELDPVPYLDPVDDLGFDEGSVDGVVLSDGHTRAFAAVLMGVESLPTRRDPDRGELPLDVYRECVGWCLDADVTCPGDFVGRVVSRERFLTDWVERCQALEE